VLCDRLSQWPLALTGSYWLQASIVLGAVAVALREPPPLRRIGALFAILWSFFLVVWISGALGINGLLPFAPVYFYLMMYPLWAFFSLYAGVTLVLAIISGLRLRSDRLHLYISGTVCAAAVALALLFRAHPANILKPRNLDRSATTPITATLQREIALRPGEVFRGSVATLLGSPGSPLRALVLGDDARALQPDTFEQFIGKLAADTGNTHDLLDLWRLHIPTLSEYGQAVSKPLTFYVSHVLNAPQDAQHPSFAFPRLANIDVLRAMGVRFVITDFALPENGARMAHMLPLKGGIDLRLYELPNPNIAGFSPTKLFKSISAWELQRRIAANSAFFETEAFVDGSTIATLVPAERRKSCLKREGCMSARTARRAPHCCCRSNLPTVSNWKANNRRKSRCCVPT
jgi:hypothetical protein